MSREPNQEAYAAYNTGLPSFGYDQWPNDPQLQNFQARLQEQPGSPYQQEYPQSTFPFLPYDNSSLSLLPPSSQASSQSTDEVPSQHVADAGDQLREMLSIPLGVPVNLYAIPDPGPEEKAASLPVLIKLAIYGSPRKQLTLQEIYAALIARFEWFKKRENDQSWKNSIRHNLSLNKVFRIAQRPITEPGKGQYWTVDVSEGEGYKRPRKRRPKNRKNRRGGSSSASARAASEEDDELGDTSEGSPGPMENPSNTDHSPGSVGRSASTRRRSPLASSSSQPYVLSQALPISRSPPLRIGEHSSLASSAPHSAPASFRPEMLDPALPSFAHTTSFERSLMTSPYGQFDDRAFLPASSSLTGELKERDEGQYTWEDNERAL